MKFTILDCYVDEPACLGVPPYLSPYPRYLAGAIEDAGHEYIYLTIDEYRRNSDKVAWISECDALVLLGGAIVPGKYLRGMPASLKEISKIACGFRGIKVLGGPIAKFGFLRCANENSNDIEINRLANSFDYIARQDVDCAIFDYLEKGKFSSRYRTLEELETWACRGTKIVKSHPDFPKPLIVEIETYRGCVRYFTGGCSFCTEPLYGRPRFRKPKDIINEITELGNLGVVNFRLGAQTCIFCYNLDDTELGKTETPKPNVEAIRELFAGIRKNVPHLEVLHVDNANPAIIATYPKESEEIIRILLENCTPGNVLAFGLESADKNVAKENNLNSSAEQTMAAIKLVNKLGSNRGYNGMPNLLPGINILSGLKGETKDTFEINFAFLKEVFEQGLMLRRINIRQVASIRTEFDTKKNYHEFKKFKEKVRNEIDAPMLKRVVPIGTVLRDVYAEVKIGGITFARQIGTYPLLVGIPYSLPLERFYDVAIVSHGQRSVTGIEYPLKINSAPIKAIECLPGIGSKRAARIVRSRPFHSLESLQKCLDDPSLANSILNYIQF